MQPPQEKYVLSLESARKSLQTADHLTYISFPFLKENRLLLKILEEISLSLLNIINSILQYEYLYKRIQVYNNARDNFETFKKIAARYSINNEQLAEIIEILNITEKHKKSPFEFVKNDKIVILSSDMKTDTLTIEKIKLYLLEVKDILRKVSIVIKKTEI